MNGCHTRSRLWRCFAESERCLDLVGNHFDTQVVRLDHDVRVRPGIAEATDLEVIDPLRPSIIFASCAHGCETGFKADNSIR
jgi:hypothetical protein